MNKLLRDVMMDACQKMRGEEVSELLFLTILEMIELVMRAHKEGLLVLEDALESEDVPKELVKEVFAIPLGIELCVDGESNEHMTEILVTKYWVHNPQGVYAMANYIAIRALNAIDENYDGNWMSLERLLTACLPDGYEEMYKGYKEKHFLQFKMPTNKERLMKSEMDWNEENGFIVTVKNKLEKKIMEIPEDMLRSFIDAQTTSQEKQYNLEAAIKGLSNETRKRLFSCMTKETEDEIIDSSCYMGPIRLCDLMDVLTYLLIEIMEYEKIWKAL
ncbi:MAG: hypothetical protein NC489_27685 [Ruminococcus flavefaciens]|nr:hypothetical protein [Ruminococcus flavefaciens]